MTRVTSGRTIMALASLAVSACAASGQAQGVCPLLDEVRRPNVGKQLLAEDFGSGTFARWRKDRGWSIVDRENGGGKCARVMSSKNDYEDLILKKPIPIVPGHRIAACWKARFLSGKNPLFLRVDFFDATGKQREARQVQSEEASTWTANAVLVSGWFPAYTRAITVHFHHGPNAQTTSLLGDIRVVDLAPRLTAAEVKQLAAASADLPASPVNDYWKATIASHLSRLRASAETDVAGATYVRRFMDAIPWLRRREVRTRRVLAYATKPITSAMVLPNTFFLPGSIVGRVALSACPGEHEPASLVLWAPEKVPSLLVAASDLRGAKGSIAAGNVDIKHVKCWFQAGSAWRGIAQDRSRKVLVPELLLNDESLVKVDRENQRNYLKLSFPGGPKYVPIDDPKNVPWGSRYSLEEFPVRDSEVLLPIGLPAGENRQVWITVKVPDAAKAGRYAGRIALSSGQERLGSIELTLRVLPFKLSPPKTHYDLGEDFTYSLYYWGELDADGKGAISYKYKNEQQFRAELRIMFAHGIVAPAMIWSPKVVYENEPLFRKHLSIAREIGMAGRPLVLADSGLVRNPTDPEALKKLKERVRRAIEVAGEYDFTGVYFYGIDEARAERLLSQRKAWQAVHEAGGKIFVSGYQGHLEQVGDTLDLFNRSGPSERARPAEWHKRGNKIWNYGNPQTPVENPQIYRRNYGLFLWRLDYDGACTYCFMDSSGRQWNDLDCDRYRDHNVAYPTVDGVVGTLALEGFREGVDDVKYATVLRLAIQQALKDGTPKAKDTAARALRWLDGLDMKRVDLDEVRAGIIREILALRGESDD